MMQDTALGLRAASLRRGHRAADNRAVERHLDVAEHACRKAETAGIVIVVAIEPSTTFRAENIPPPCVPDRLIACPVSSSNSETGGRKSSRFDITGRSTG
jgi:hypothetical protein